MKRIISLFAVLALVSALPALGFAAVQMPEDCLYSIGVTSSSKMFRVTACQLEVKQGAMTAILTLSSDSYGFLYQGTVEEADAAPRENWIAPIDATREHYSFRVPIPALDEPVEVAAWSKKYEKWYDRQLTFLSGSLRAEQPASKKSATPVPANGRYTLEVHADSPLLQVEHCILTVDNGVMQAEMTMKDSKYGFLFPGLAKGALLADVSQHIPLIPDSDGKATATLPVFALDEEQPVATWSEKKNLWYDRTLQFDSATLKPLDKQAQPSFSFTGGTGRTTISLKSLDEASGLATITFSSSSYTQVKVGGEVYRNENPAGDATFTLPLSMNGETKISAETVAMSKPRWVEYSLFLYTDGSDAAQFAGSEAKQGDPSPVPQSLQRPEIQGLNYTGEVAFEYAAHVRIYAYEGGARLIQTVKGRNYLLVPAGAEIPDGLDDAIIILRQPLDNVYLVASAAMSLIDAIKALPNLHFTGTKAEGWYIQAAKEAMDAGNLRYAGKYSAPDYELLLSGRCDLSIQSTMVLQAPDVQQKFKELGIPLLIDLSGLESHPLGRTEWVKVYGVLFGREEDANQVFELQKEKIENLPDQPEQNPSVAYFYVNSNGAVVSKPAADYIPSLIGLAGGNYLGPESRSSETASVTMDMEAFYALAKSADFLIYNAAIDTAPENMADLLLKNQLFADFKAVQNHQVYVASPALYQSSHRFGDAAKELHAILTYQPLDLSDGFFQKIQ